VPKRRSGPSSECAHYVQLLQYGYYYYYYYNYLGTEYYYGIQRSGKRSLNAIRKSTCTRMLLYKFGEHGNAVYYVLLTGAEYW